MKSSPGAPSSLAHSSCQHLDFLLQASSTSCSISRYTLNVLRQQMHCTRFCCKGLLDSPCCSLVHCMGAVREGWEAQRPLLCPIHNAGERRLLHLCSCLITCSASTHESRRSERANIGVPDISSPAAHGDQTYLGQGQNRALHQLAGSTPWLIGISNSCIHTRNRRQNKPPSLQGVLCLKKSEASGPVRRLGASMGKHSCLWGFPLRPHGCVPCPGDK